MERRERRDRTGGGWTDRIVVVNTTTGVTLEDTTLAMVEPLAAGETRARQFAFRLPRGAAGAGEIVITVTSDSADAIAESNGSGTGETNNTATITRSATVPPDVDLAVTAVDTDGIEPVVGWPLTVRWTVRNGGADATSGSWGDRILIVNTTTGATVLDTTVASSGSLAGGATVTRRHVFTLPASAGAGPLRVTVTADVADAVPETNATGTAETNNSLEVTQAVRPSLLWVGGIDGTGTDFFDPANWAGGVLPNTGDTVVIGDTGSTAPIRIGSWTNVGEIRTSRGLVLTQGASLDGTRLIGTGGAAVSFVTDRPRWQTSARLTNVRTNMDLDLGSSSLTVELYSLTLEGASIRLGDATGQITSQAVVGGTGIFGTGSVVFGGSRDNLIGVAAGGLDDFTIGSGITIRGNAGRISNYEISRTIRNEGTIIADAIVARPTDRLPVGVTTTSDIRTYTTSSTIDTSGVTDPLPVSAYQAARWAGGETTYAFDGLAAGATHRVRLHFADFVSGWANMAVSINGTAVLSGFNPQQAAGGMYRALVREFDAVADSQGRIRVAFSGDNNFFNAIEVVRDGARVGYCDGSGGYPGQIRIETADFENHGTIGASGFGTLVLAGTWDLSAGTAAVQGGTVNLVGTIDPGALGRWTRSGGTVNVVGTIENTGRTFRLDAATGSWTLAGGTLRGGRLETADGTALRIGRYPEPNQNPDNVLDGVEVAGSIDATSGSSVAVRVINGLVLAGGTIRLGDRVGMTAAQLYVGGTQTIGGTGTIVFGTSSQNFIQASGQATDVFTIGPGVTIRGSAGRIESPSWAPVRIVNQGTILADASVPYPTDVPFARTTGVTKTQSYNAYPDPIDTSAIVNPLPQAVYRRPWYPTDGASLRFGGLTPAATYR
ncbi:MAG: hypothetical protein EBZ59_09495, partial [Planctomycetia bacterium]|nr:hypothetical protein [Planctomycetia bacterium]